MTEPTDVFGLFERVTGHRIAQNLASRTGIEPAVLSGFGSNCGIESRRVFLTSTSHYTMLGRFGWKFGVPGISSWNQIISWVKGSRNLASQRSTLILVTYCDETSQVPNHRSVR